MLQLSWAALDWMIESRTSRRFTSRSRQMFWIDRARSSGDLSQLTVRQFRQRLCFLPLRDFAVVALERSPSLN
jgi:hypothetical protein